MANWCNNYLVLSGTDAAIQNTIKIFSTIEEQQNRTGKYYLPEFVTAESSQMTDIVISENTINYQTRWIPNLEALVQIARHTGVDFVSQYDELAMGILGAATYQKGEFYNVQLDNYDLQSYHYEMDTATYLYNGQHYEDEWSILMELLEIKKTGLREFKTTSSVTKEKLLKTYGELLPFDIVLKFAEHKNFDKARETFMALDHYTKNELDNYLINSGRKTIADFETREKFIAFNYMTRLVNEWIGNRRTNDYQSGLSR